MAKITNVNCKLEVRTNCKYYMNSASVHMEVLKTTRWGIVLQLLSLLILAVTKNSLSFRELIIYGMSFLLVAYSYHGFSQLEILFARVLKGYSWLIIIFAFLGLLGFFEIVQNNGDTIIGLGSFSPKQLGISFWMLWFVLLIEWFLSLLFYLVSWAAFSFSPERRIQNA